MTGLSTRDSPDSWPNDFSPASNPPSASILPENRETEDPSTERAEVLRSYNAKITLTEGVKSDLHWWASEMEKQNGRNLQILQWDMVLESDASKEGWGVNYLGVSTGGLWTQEEQKHHINYLELLAAFLALNPLRGTVTLWQYFSESTM